MKINKTVVLNYIEWILLWILDYRFEEAIFLVGFPNFLAHLWV